MFDSLRKFVDIVFKGLGIFFILVVFVFSGILLKSCMMTAGDMDRIHSEVSR